jgi:hypothetical protein
MGAMPGLVGLTRRRAATAVTDHGRGKWIGGCNGGRPARSDGKICTAKAIRTMGRKFFSRRRIAKPIRVSPNHLPGAVSRPGWTAMFRLPQ